MYTKEYVLDLFRRVSQIPFIDLGPIPNFDQMQSEVIAAYKSTAVSLNPMHSKHYENDLYLNLGVRGVYDYDGLNDIAQYCHSCLAFEEDYKHLIPRFFGKTEPTKFSKQMPLLTSYISDIFDHPGRCRFSVLHSFEEVGWHTHYYDSRCEITFHIAFQTDPEILAQVGPIDPLTLKSVADWHKAPETYYSKHFDPGQLWLLNSRHSHRFINPTDVNRIHLWGTTWLFDADNETPINIPFIKKLDEIDKNYTGIRMPLQADVSFQSVW